MIDPRLEGNRAPARRAREDPMFYERRASIRHKIFDHVEAVVFFGERQIRATIADISDHGLRLVIVDAQEHPLPHSLQVGSHIEVAVKEDDRVIECEVRNIQDGEIGLRYFDAVTNTRRKALINKIVS
jgi:c-di-GMP-binding flagellar brake protein YcgR